jgi:plastocyanin
MNKKITLAIIPLIGILFIAAVSVSMITFFSHNREVQAAVATSGTITNSSSMVAMGNVIKVEAGRGNASAIVDHFFPENAEIKVGQSITWFNPTKVSEPHTVSIILDNKTMTGPVAPFALNPSSTQFTPLPPSSNNEPVKVPGKSVVVVAVNARSYIPTVIDSQGTVKHSPPNASYTMNGSEKYVNSGWLLPKGQEQDFPGSSNTFTVTFQKVGIYKYVCILHPWMQGLVKVK